MRRVDCNVLQFAIEQEVVALKYLRPGALFVTPAGTYAVKSEYFYSTGMSLNSQYQCILLESGEYAHFAEGNATLVREVRLPRLESDNQHV